MAADNLDDINVAALEADLAEAASKAEEYRRRVVYLRRIIHSVRVLRGEIDPDDDVVPRERSQPRLFRDRPQATVERVPARLETARAREVDKAVRLRAASEGRPRELTVRELKERGLTERELKAHMAGVEAATEAAEAAAVRLAQTLPSDTRERPTGTGAIRAVLREHDRVWRVADLHRELESRGWISPDIQNPRRTTDATISRLVKQGEVLRVGQGLYRWAGHATNGGSAE